MTTLNGNRFNNFLVGDRDRDNPDDVLNGLEGNDFFRPGDGRDIIDGGVGIDTLDYSKSLSGKGSQGVFIDLNQQTATDPFGEHDTIIDIENITATRLDDQIQADDHDNVIKGLNGEDILFGGGGNDRLYGGKDNDILGGGLGEDYLHGGSGDDLIDGGLGEDRLYGCRGDDTLGSFSDDSDDIMTGGWGSDTFAFGTTKNVATFGHDRITDWTDDGFWRISESKQDKLDIRIDGLDGNDQVVAVRDGTVLNILVDEDGDTSDLSDAVRQGSIRFQSEFAVDNLDADDLVDPSTIDVFIG